MFWAAALCGVVVGLLWNRDVDPYCLPLLWVPWGLGAWFALWITPLGDHWYSSFLNSFGILGLGFGHWLLGSGVYHLLAKRQDSKFSCRAST